MQPSSAKLPDATIEDQMRARFFFFLSLHTPVKMLGPLIIFIFPCTFIVLGFPIVMKFMQSGI